MAESKQTPATESVGTGARADAASSAGRPHGDKLVAAGSGMGEVASAVAKAGDSPKRHGDELKRAVEQAAKR